MVAGGSGAQAFEIEPAAQYQQGRRFLIVGGGGQQDLIDIVQRVEARDRHHLQPIFAELLRTRARILKQGRFHDRRHTNAKYDLGIRREKVRRGITRRYQAHRYKSHQGQLHSTPPRPQYEPARPCLKYLKGYLTVL